MSSDLNQITGGTIHLVERRRLGEYEHREGSATITFAVGDGQDPDITMQAAVAMAQAKVALMITGQHIAPAAAKTRGRPPKVDATAEPVKLADQKATLDPGADEPSDPFDRTASVPSETPVAGSDATSAAKSAETSPSSSAPVSQDPALPTAGTAGSQTAEDEWASVPQISDKAITDACAKRNGEIQDPPAIRNLIAKYVPAGGQARQIAQEKRAEFLAALEALPKKG